MRILNLLTVIALFVGVSTACTSTAGEKQETTVAEKGDVEVYYFHNERRCATCKAVEAVSAKSLQELYGEKVPFSVYNLESAEGQAKAAELEVSGQTLLIVKGEQKINITNPAFMNARNNPEKLKQVIQEKIGPLM